MKTIVFLSAIFLSAYAIKAQQFYTGQAAEDAPKEITQWSEMIGKCDCKSQNRNPDGTWQEETDVLWQWKYILGGTAVQDETIKSDGTYTSSIRQYNVDSAKWVVTFFASSTPAFQPGTWVGNREDGGDFVLFKDQPAPNGTPGDSRLTFSSISEKGFNWIGEWVSKDGNITYPFWKISCVKRKE